MDEPFLDAICERLRQKTYIKGGTILYRGGFVTKMLFIVRGKMESIGEDGSIVPLCEGDACGEELLRWCLEHSSINGGIIFDFFRLYILDNYYKQHLTFAIISDSIIYSRIKILAQKIVSSEPRPNLINSSRPGP